MKKGLKNTQRFMKDKLELLIKALPCKSSEFFTEFRDMNSNK